MDIQPPRVRVPIQDEELQGVFAMYGFAMHQAQALEVALVNLLFASRFNRGRHMTGPAARRLAEGLQKRTTMGKQFETVLREARLEPDVIRRLNRALKTRNRLAHGWFSDHELISHAALRAALKELEEILDEFERLSRKPLLSSGPTTTIVAGSGCRAGEVVGVAFNFVACDREQEFLLPPSLREWLPDGHLAWFLIDAVEEMRLDAFLSEYRADGWGRAAYDPRMMVTLLLYAYAIGERSSRQIERRCREDVAFRVISANVVPDHATIARFRERHEQALGELFVEVLRLCAAAGLVRVGVVAIDGTKIAANASLRANRSYAAIGEEVERILAEAAEADAAEDALYGEACGDELPAELAERTSRLARLRAARARLEAEVDVQQTAHERRLEQRAAKEAVLPAGQRLRGRKPTPPPTVVAAEAKANTSDPDSRILRDGIAYVQGYNAQAAVAEGQIIVAAELVQDTNDRHQLTPMLATTEEALAAIGHEQKIGVCLADAGYWDTDALEMIVESGQHLIVNPDTSNPRRQRVADPPHSYPRAPRMEGIRLAMHETLASDEGRALYAARRELAEPVFGQTKVTRRADRFLRRGLDACQSEWRLICATHNLLKLWRQPALPA